ncbi:hypothetical protein RF11_16431 [Thelohanellus kitauei]|uniref:Uncharacterized protein n=1 Tax=Thelohanellus kitauei TaxID=669202 RepID=A0A0C2I7H1_THEKT|nr:hypothetical protein RF11_16431 [Thelohanellus kitauei]
MLDYHTCVLKAKGRNSIRMVYFQPKPATDSHPLRRNLLRTSSASRLHLLCRSLNAMDEGKECHKTFLKSLHVARSDWDRESNSTITNYFAKTQFIKNDTPTERHNTEL